MFFRIEIRDFLWATLLFCLLCLFPDVMARELRLTSQMPEDSLLHDVLSEFKGRVEKETNKEITIRVFPNAQLFKGPEVKSEVGSGRIEMGASLISEYEQLTPVVQIFSIPFLFHNKAVSASAIEPGSLVRAPIDDEIRKVTGSRVLWWLPLADFTTISVDKFLRVPKDFAGQKIAAFSSSTAELIKLCGGDPVLAPGPEHYNLYKNRRAIGSIYAIDALVSRKFYEVLNMMLMTRIVYEPWVILINDRVWQALTDEQRRIISKAAREVEILGRAKLSVIEKESLERAKQNGMRISEITDEEIDEWKECSSIMSENYLARSGLAGNAVLSGYRKILIESSAASKN
jgi:C4-dicarboxylate-binding protein DctP